MTIYFWGSEDSEINSVGGATVDTTAGRFSSRVACGLSVPCNQIAGAYQTQYWRSLNQFAAANFWWTGRMWTNGAGTTNFSGMSRAPAFWLRFLDSNGYPRLRIVSAVTGVVSSGPSGPWVIEKVNAAGTATQLGTLTFAGPSVSILQKLTVHVNYAVSGSIDVYMDGVLVFTYSGDVTTDSTTNLAGFDLGIPISYIGNGSAATGVMVWSEVAVTDFDARSVDLYKLTINGAGASSDWTGTAAGTTVNEVTLSDADGIDSATANQIELFTQPGTMPSGNFTILGVGLAARASAATGGTPQHLDMALRIGGANYFSSDQTVSIGLDRVGYVWGTSPASSTTFTGSEISTMQIGVKSIA